MADLQSNTESALGIAGATVTNNQEQQLPGLATVQLYRAVCCELAKIGAAITGPDAADVTYTPTTVADWDSSADPGNVDDGLDQLAERVKDLELLYPPDAAVVTYVSAVAADWNGSADPGDVDNALDQLAERVKDIEGLYPPDASIVTYTPGTSGNWPAGDPGDVDNGLDTLASFLAGLRVPIASGDWTSGAFIGEPNYTSFATVAAADTLVGVPFFCPWRITFTSIGMTVSTGPLNARAKFGIYAMGAGGLPGARLYDGSASPVDIDTVTAGGTVLGELTGIAQTLNPGWYVLAVLVNGGTVGAINIQAEGRTSRFGNRTTSLNGGSTNYWDKTSTYASGLPDPFGTPSTYNIGNTTPRLMLKVT